MHLSVEEVMVALYGEKWEHQLGLTHSTSRSR